MATKSNFIPVIPNGNYSQIYPCKGYLQTLVINGDYTINVRYYFSDAFRECKRRYELSVNGILVSYSDILLTLVKDYRFYQRF